MTIGRMLVLVVVSLVMVGGIGWGVMPALAHPEPLPLAAQRTSDIQQYGGPAEAGEAGAAAASVEGEGVCTDTASVQLSACQAQVQEAFLTASALCLQLPGNAARARCFREAEATREEESLLCRQQREAREDVCDALGEGRYTPHFIPALFDDDFTNLTNPNPYFPLGIGYRWAYAGGEETISIEVLNQTKLIQGVTCIVVNDRVEEAGQLIEDTDDWYGQRLNGTVDYCGEIAKNYETFEGDTPPLPELVDIHGSWKAGRDGLPGTLFPGSPTVGAFYRQEFKPNEAEDVALVLSTTYHYGSDPQLDQYVPQALAEHLCNHDCVVTREFTPIDPRPGAFERKYYASGIGLFLEIAPTGDIVQLTDCNVDSRCADLP